MKTIVQIITQNQSAYIESMIEATKNFERIWVADRCIDDTVDKLRSMNENVIINTEGEGFLAGRMRDKGLDYVLDKEYDVVVMLDGDRVPFNLTNELIEKEMEKGDASLGFCETDGRKTCYDLIHSQPYNKMFTCGVIIKTKFLKRVRKLKIMEGRCFHKNFDEVYGNEDIFLGICLFSIGAKVIAGDLMLKGRVPSKFFANAKESEIRLLSLKERIGIWK